MLMQEKSRGSCKVAGIARVERKFWTRPIPFYRLDSSSIGERLRRIVYWGVWIQKILRTWIREKGTLLMLDETISYWE